MKLELQRGEPGMAGCGERSEPKPSAGCSDNAVGWSITQAARPIEKLPDAVGDSVGQRLDTNAPPNYYDETR